MNVFFLSELSVRKEENGTWVVLAPFSVGIALYEGGDLRTYSVPPGFRTDFASVPRIPFAYWLTGNTAHRSAVLHDYLYSQQYTRKFSDDAFLAAMKTEGVPSWQRYLMYAALRLFGWIAYRKSGERS